MRRLSLSAILCGAITAGAWFDLAIGQQNSHPVGTVPAIAITEVCFPYRSSRENVAVFDDSPRNQFLFPFNELRYVGGGPRHVNYNASVALSSIARRKVEFPDDAGGHYPFLVRHIVYLATGIISEFSDFGLYKILYIVGRRLPLILSPDLHVKIATLVNEYLASNNPDISPQLALGGLSAVPYLTDYQTNQQDVGDGEHEGANSNRIVDKLFEKPGYPFIVSLIISVACGAIGITLNLKANASWLSITAGMGLIALAFLNTLVPLWIVVLYFFGVLQ